MKYLITVSGLLAIVFGVSPAAIAQMNGQAPETEEAVDMPYQEELSAFRRYADVTVGSINVPTVVEVPLSGMSFQRRQFAVENRETGKFLPHYFDRDRTIEPVVITAESNGSSASAMVDGNERTFASFEVSERGDGEARIVLEAARAITSSELSLLLEAYVALPTQVTIRAGERGSEEVVVAPRRLSNTRITFPQTTARRWVIVFSHSQPLRISELELVQQNVQRSVKDGLRFLAHPGQEYRIYADADRSVSIPTDESPNLRSDTGVVELAAPSFLDNPMYQQSDVDEDGVPDVRDNCVNVSNPDQEDIDGNGRGDACDDWDRDGVINSKDNCPEEPNRNQRDEDGDGIGDACDDEESRTTERYPWLVWLGLGGSGAILIVLFALMYWSPARREEDETPVDTLHDDTPPGAGSAQ